MKTGGFRVLAVALVFWLIVPLAAVQAAKKKARAKESPPAAEVRKKAPQEIKTPKKAPPPAIVETKPAPKIETAATAFPPAELTVGFQARDAETEGLGDLLIPVWNPGGQGLLFVNPRAAFTDHDGEEGNLGVGYRQLLPKQSVILGGNVYYDYRDTGEFNYDQWGFGIELLSPWIDARANYYDPDDDRNLVASQTETSTRQSVSTSADWQDPYAADHYILQDYVVTRTVTTTTRTKTYEQFEQALGGYDWEIGLRLPLPVKAEKLEARVFGGYYDFDNDLGAEVDGWKARAELRLASSLFLDAGVYEDDQLTGSDWFAGARLSVPLDLSAIAKGRNPFATAKSRLEGAPRDLAARLTEMVMRDPQVRLDVSKFIENPDLATEQITRSRDKDSTAYVLLPDVQFVDGGAGAPGDGTAENPFPTIQQGANAVYGSRNVYVNAFPGIYPENVVLLPGTTLWGSGVLVPGFDNKFFGSEIQPVVDGRSLGPSITVADNTTVKGFFIQNTESGGPSRPVLISGLPTAETRRAGIFGNNVTDLIITQNTLAGNASGALFLRNGSFDLTFEDNLVANNTGTGVEVEGINGETFTARFTRNTILRNEGAGLLIDSVLAGEAWVRVKDCAILNNDLNGLETRLNTVSGDADLRVFGSRITGNGDHGIYFGLMAFPGSGDASIIMDNSAIRNNGNSWNVEGFCMTGTGLASIVWHHFWPSTFSLTLTTFGGTSSFDVTP